MNDLEITRLCAEALGYTLEPYSKGVRCRNADGYVECVIGESLVTPHYDPLADDAQAMALVKKFDLSVWGHQWCAGEWKYHAEFSEDGDGANSIIGHGADHNHAICECVAQMQASKP